MKDIKTDYPRILLTGIGNSGRADDGLGWAFAEQVREACAGKMDIEFRYQLQIEDTVLISAYDIVIFADASHESLTDGFVIRKCFPGSHYYYSSHVQSPETILYLARELYQEEPIAYTIAIEGYQWRLQTGMSVKAAINLQSALSVFLHDFVPAFMNNTENKKGLVSIQ